VSISGPEGPTRYGRMGPRPEPAADDHGTQKGLAMPGAITDSDRSTMLRAAVSKVGRDELKQALHRSSSPDFQVPRPVGNALNALRKHRDPTAVVGKTPYRAALPAIAAAIAEPCLSRTIEVLGDEADDPTRDQLLAALDKIGEEFPPTVVGVMLASVADGGMPASDLCFDIVASDGRFGLVEWSEVDAAAAPAPAAAKPAGGLTPEQRQARRLKKQKDAEERRAKLEATRRAADQVRQARKKERSQSGNSGDHRPEATGDGAAGTVPRLIRRAALTPVQLEEFDPHDPWVTAVVSAWVPFEPADQVLDGKARPCVVVAGSATHLLVRPGYSQGGLTSRDWRSVPLRHWRKSGFAQPTWISLELVRVERDEDEAPMGWLTPEDWNSLW
jgi:hypothetical protein